MLWSVGVIAEVALFAVSGRVIAYCGTARLLMLAGLAATLRWGVMAFDPPLWATALLQTLHAMSFGAAHLAAIHFMTHAVPEDRAATAQGVYAAIVAGLVLGTVTIASGPLYRTFAGEAYAAMALLALHRRGSRLHADAALAWRPGRRRLSPTAPAAAARPSRLHKSSPGTRSRASSSGPSRSTQSASCATQQGRGHGERRRDHAAHHDLQAERARLRRAAASASVSPPVLSSLMFTAS